MVLVIAFSINVYAEGDIAFCSEAFKSMSCDSIPKNERKGSAYIRCCMDGGKVNACALDGVCLLQNDKKRVVCFDNGKKETVYVLSEEATNARKSPSIWDKFLTWTGLNSGKKLRQAPDVLDKKLNKR